jgi:hypothetical protein
LRDNIELSPDKTLKEIGTGFRGTDASILYAIKQLGITDKNLLIQGAGQEKHRAFTKFLSKKQVKDIVFGNESGISHQDMKECAWSEKRVKVIEETSGAVCRRRTTVITRISCRKIMASFYFDDCTHIGQFYI